MKTNISKTLSALVCAVALVAACAFSGCAPGGTTASAASEKANRAYMSQVNETMVELDQSLDQFVDAVSRGDIVNMRAQADNAYKVLDKLAAIEAPDSLKGVRDDYVNGTAKLRTALDKYIALYAEMANGDSSGSGADYEKRIAEIQSLYDEGVALLKSGDEVVAGTSQASASQQSSSSAASASSESSAESSSSASSESPASSSSSASSESASASSASSR